MSIRNPRYLLSESGIVSFLWEVALRNLEVYTMQAAGVDGRGDVNMWAMGFG